MLPGSTCHRIPFLGPYQKTKHNTHFFCQNIIFKVKAQVFLEVCLSRWKPSCLWLPVVYITLWNGCGIYTLCTWKLCPQKNIAICKMGFSFRGALLLQYLFPCIWFYCSVFGNRCLVSIFPSVSCPTSLQQFSSVVSYTKLAMGWQLFGNAIQAFLTAC